MKITKSLKTRIALVAVQVAIGSLSDLGALADALQAIIDEARAQDAGAKSC